MTGLVDLTSHRLLHSHEGPQTLTVRGANGDLVRRLPELDFGAVDIHALHPGRRRLALRTRVFLDALIAHLSDGEPAAFVPV